MKEQILHKAQWLSWLERRPVTAEVIGSSPFWVVCRMFGKLFADVAQFMTIDERSESSVGRAVDCKSAAGVNFADVAQLAEQLICNQQVIGSIPIVGFCSLKYIWVDSRVAKGDRL